MNEKKSSKNKPKRSWRWVLRLLRSLLVPALCVIAVIAGLYIGYSVVGGQSSADIWHLQTWKHMIDLVLPTSELPGPGSFIFHSHKV